MDKKYTRRALFGLLAAAPAALAAKPKNEIEGEIIANGTFGMDLSEFKNAPQFKHCAFYDCVFHYNFPSYGGMGSFEYKLPGDSKWRKANSLNDLDL